MNGTKKVIWEEEGEHFWQLLTFPEEDRHLHTSAPWDGGYRWFRSPNIIPLEKYRRIEPADSSQRTA